VTAGWPTISGVAKVMQHLLKDDTQVYKQFVENESFKRFVGDMVYVLTS
jgi:type I restriction enzyme R subunit